MKKKEMELPKDAVLGYDVAESELEKWFDYRRVKESARNVINEDLGKDFVRENLIEGFVYGQLEFNPETGILTQKLEYPIKKESGEVILNSFDYKPRIQRRELTEPLKGVKAMDTEGRMVAWISAVTGVQKLKLGALDQSDYSLAENVINYFLK